jgi:hypothetical protein
MKHALKAADRPARDWPLKRPPNYYPFVCLIMVSTKSPFAPQKSSFPSWDLCWSSIISDHSKMLMVSIFIWQGVAIDFLLYHLGQPCLTLLRPADGPPLKLPSGRFREGLPTGQAACDRLLPPYPMPYAYEGLGTTTEVFFIITEFAWISCILLWGAYKIDILHVLPKPIYFGTGMTPFNEIVDEGMALFHRGSRGRPIWLGLSKGVEDSHKALSGVARPQGVKGLGMAGPGETLGSLWILLAVRACLFHRGSKGVFAIKKLFCLVERPTSGG